MPRIEFRPDAPMSGRLARYVEAICRGGHARFDPAWTVGEARELLRRMGVIVSRADGGVDAAESARELV